MSMEHSRYGDVFGSYWQKGGYYHREDGPAVELADGTKKWYVDGRLHRIDGPAIELSNGRTKWFVDGQYVDILAIFGYDPSIPLSEEEQMILWLSI